MTRTELEAVIGRIRVGGLLALIDLQIKVRELSPHWDEYFDLELRFQVPDRENFLHSIPLKTNLRVEQRWDEEQVFRYIRWQIRELLVHESDEGFLVDGMRTDPHTDKLEPVSEAVTQAVLLPLHGRDPREPRKIAEVHWRATPEQVFTPKARESLVGRG